MTLSLEEIAILCCTGTFADRKGGIIYPALAMLNKGDNEYTRFSLLIDQLISNRFIVKQGTDTYFISNEGKETLKKNYKSLQDLCMKVSNAILFDME